MIEGIINPIIVPFTETDEVDEDLLLTFAEDSISAGVSALFILGSAGQGPTMTTEERIRSADIVIKHVKKRIPVIVHVGTTHLRSTVELAAAAESSGADAIGVIPPYYYSDHPAAEIDLHFKGVAAACSLPMVVYNNKEYSGTHISPQWLARLAEEIPTISGVKLAHAGMAQIAAYLRLAPEGVAIYSGTTLDLVPMGQFGLHGAINPPSCLFPELVVAVWNAVAKGDWQRAHELQGILVPANTAVIRLGATYGRSIMREGLRFRGYDIKKYPRWESQDVPQDVLNELRQVLEPTWEIKN